MLIAPTTLALITTNRCTASCDHCCFGCNPRNTASLSVADMHRYIDHAKTVPTLKVVVFTGGECFLFGKGLDELVEHASRNGYVTRFVSNGYWAVSRGVARRRLSRLKSLGLKEANFSTGEEHARFVSPILVRNGAIEAANLGLHTAVAIESLGDSRFDFDDFMDHKEFSRQVETGKVLVKMPTWVKCNGRRPVAYANGQLRQLQQFRSMAGGCASMLRSVAITPTQSVYVCCGLTSENMPEMKLGSLDNGQTFAQLLAAAPDDFVKIWIHLFGPDALLRYAQKLDPSIDSPGHHAHICDTCRYVYGNRRVRELILARPPDNMRAMVDQYARSAMIPLGTSEGDLPKRALGYGIGVNDLKKQHKQTLFLPPKSQLHPRGNRSPLPRSRQPGKTKLAPPGLTAKTL